MRSPTIKAGALVGALFTTSLTAILYLAQQIAGLPFAPFRVFDWMARALPGSVVTFGIDTMVALIRALRVGGPADIAKPAEQTLAILGLLATGTVAGAAVFGAMRSSRFGGSRSPRRAITAGLIAGSVLGLAVALIVATSPLPGPPGPVLGALWTAVAFLAWGAGLGWSWQRLAGVRSVAPSSAAAPPPAAAPSPAAPSPAAESSTGVTVEPVDRRTFMIRLGGATAVVTVAGAALGGALARGRQPASDASARWSSNNPLPNTGAAVDPARGTRPEFTPLDDHYRIDINTLPPRVAEVDWRLEIAGLVDRPASLTLAQVQSRYEPMHQFVTLACISNPIAGDLTSTTRWTGASVRSVLEDVGVSPDATHLRIRSVDGFDETLEIALAMADARVMLTYAFDGVPLPTKHGFPLRIYIPDRYGMKQPKWIQSIEAVDAWEAGYWVRRGWDREARMRATSVIDTVAADMMMIDADTQPMRVPIGGIAHAGARGISRVEVRVDDGEWQAATLRDPLSATTWVVWRFDWPFSEGRHTFTVRCFERDGTPQIATESPVRPSGATGLHTMDRMM